MHDIDSKTSIDATAGATDEASRRYPGWRVVFVCFVMAALVWGFGFYGHGFYLAELQRRHGWPASLIGGASTLYYLFSALLVVFISDAIRRFGVRACVLVGRLRARRLGGGAAVRRRALAAVRGLPGDGVRLGHHEPRRHQRHPGAVVRAASAGSPSAWP